MNKFTTHDWNSLEQQFIAETGQMSFYEDIGIYNPAYIEWLDTRCIAESGMAGRRDGRRRVPRLIGGRLRFY